MGISHWESRGNGNKTKTWEWGLEGMEIECMGKGGNGNFKMHSLHLYT